MAESAPQWYNMGAPREPETVAKPAQHDAASGSGGDGRDSGLHVREESCKPLDSNTNNIAATIFESISDGVFTTDRDCRITAFNKAAEKITGFSREQAVGRYCFDIFRTELCQSRCALRHTLQNGEPSSNVRVSIVARDGQNIPVDVSTTLLRDEEGQPVGAVEFFRDLSVEEELRGRLTQCDAFANLHSGNASMQRILQLLPQVAKSECNVLVQGPSGSGKELVAQAIHNMSPRRHGPYVCVNCTALPENLLESELFGYAKGAFTDAKRNKPGQFELASGGTLLLDEIAEMPLVLQVKLLRVLNNGEFKPLGSTQTHHADARIITSTNRDVESMVRSGAFREDLFYRVNVLTITIPALRDRIEDMGRLIGFFLERFSNRQGRRISEVSGEAMAALREYDWPGNIRELENTIEHAFVLCRGDTIKVKHLPDRIVGRFQPVNRPARPANEPLSETSIRECLRRNYGNRSKTALELGVHRSTLWRKLREYGIDTNGNA